LTWCAEGTAAARAFLSRRALVLGDDEVAAPNPGSDQALFPQHRQRTLGRALRDPVLLREPGRSWTPTAPTS